MTDLSDHNLRKPDYSFNTPPEFHDLGPCELVVYLTDQVDDHGNGITGLKLPIIDQMEIHLTRFSHPYRIRGEIRVAVGVFWLDSFSGKELECFSFGGTLQVDLHPDFTHCLLKSPAPILNLTEDITTPEQALFSEISELFARRKATWQGDDVGYNARLISIPPAHLFQACLASLEREQNHYPPALRDESYRQLHHWIGTTIRQLKDLGRWYATELYLEDLLNREHQI